MEKHEVGALFLAGSHAFTSDELAELIGNLKEIYVEVRMIENTVRVLGAKCDVFWIPVRGVCIRCDDYEVESRLRSLFGR